MDAYSKMTVKDLKDDLRLRGAKTSGKKLELVERLRAYDRNCDFRGPTYNIPREDIPDWPSKGFKQVGPEHSSLLPPLNDHFIDGYFRYRVVLDLLSCNDIKALEKGRKLLESYRVEACSYVQKEIHLYITGTVFASMKKQVSYHVKTSIKVTGEVANSACECPAGAGPHGTCKHIAAILYMLVHLKTTGEVRTTKSCTDVLQTFHQPRKSHGTGSPVKAQNLFGGPLDVDDDPRPPKFRNCRQYNDHVRNEVLNYCYSTGKDIAMRHASLQDASCDHHYLAYTLTEYMVDRGVAVNEDQAKEIEKITKLQSKSKAWMFHREWRITSSNFGAIFHATPRRDVEKLCHDLLCPPQLTTPAVIHGKQYEPIALAAFEEELGLKVEPSGLWISPGYPFLGASPDGLVGQSHTVEIKCPYSGRENAIAPAPNFPFLKYEDQKMVLRKEHPYYCQIQGQLALSGRESCYFVVYTPGVDRPCLFIEDVPFNEQFWTADLLPKLEDFFHTHFRAYVARNAASLQ